MLYDQPTNKQTNNPNHIRNWQIDRLLTHTREGSSRGVVANVLNTVILIRDLELQSPYNHIYPTPPLWLDMTHGQFLS